MEPSEIQEPAPIDVGRSRLLSAFQSDVLQGRALPRTAIHPDDHMLRFFMGHHWEHRETAWFDYFRSGWSAARTVHRLLLWHFGERTRSIRLLDFASGFGRVMRFLVRSEERRVGKECRYWRDWSSDVCSSDLFTRTTTCCVSSWGITGSTGRRPGSTTFDRAGARREPCIASCSGISARGRDPSVCWILRAVSGG